MDRVTALLVYVVGVGCGFLVGAAHMEYQAEHKTPPAKPALKVGCINNSLATLSEDGTYWIIKTDADSCVYVSQPKARRGR